MNQFDSSGLLLEALDHNLPFRDPGIVTQISTLSQLPPEGAFDGSSISLPDLFKSRGDLNSSPRELGVVDRERNLVLILPRN